MPALRPDERLFLFALTSSSCSSPSPFPLSSAEFAFFFQNLAVWSYLIPLLRTKPREPLCSTVCTRKRGASNPTR